MIISDAQVLQFMNDIKQTAPSWIAIYFNLSELKAHNQTPFILENAHLFLQKSLQGHTNKVFLLSNNDIVVFAQNIGLIKLEKFVEGLMQYFSNDPLTVKQLGKENFYRVYHLGQSFEVLFEAVQSFASNDTGVDYSKHIPLESAPILPFELMVKLQNTLRQADVSNFIRRQSICWVNDQNKLERVGMEFYLSMEGIEEVISANAKLIADFALFKYLSVLFDKKMLINIVKITQGLDPKIQIHINVNLRSIVSKEFYECHKAIKRNVVVELDRTDIVWDTPGCKFAIDFLKSHRHQVCMDLLNGPNLKLFLHSDVPCDFYKIICQEELFGIYQEDFEAFLRKVGPDKIILSRCDDMGLVNKAKNLGIRRFQGFLIEDVLRKGQKEPSTASKA